MYFFILSLENKFNDEKVVFTDQSDITLNFGNDTDTTYSSSSEFIEAIENIGLKEYMDSVGVESKFEKFVVTQAYKVRYYGVDKETGKILPL